MNSILTAQETIRTSLSSAPSVPVVESANYFVVVNTEMKRQKSNRFKPKKEVEVQRIQIMVFSGLDSVTLYHTLWPRKNNVEMSNQDKHGIGDQGVIIDYMPPTSYIDENGRERTGQFLNCREIKWHTDATNTPRE